MLQRLPVILLIVLCLFSPAFAEEEVEVKFDGDEEVAVEGEEEVVFDEEDEETATPVITAAPEHEFSGWLIVLPILCAGLLAVNVRWRNPSPEKKK